MVRLPVVSPVGALPEVGALELLTLSRSRRPSFISSAVFFPVMVTVAGVTKVQRIVAAVSDAFIVSDITTYFWSTMAMVR